MGKHVTWRWGVPWHCPEQPQERNLLVSQVAGTHHDRRARLHHLPPGEAHEPVPGIILGAPLTARGSRQDLASRSKLAADG